MSDWWAKIKTIFSKTELSSPTQPAIHEVIKRSDDHIQKYEQWKESVVHSQLLNWISEQYASYRQDRSTTNTSIDFLNTPSTKGVAIHFGDMNYSTDDARFLFDYFREAIKKHNYRTQVSDTRTYSKSTWVETVERHYLKPRPQYDDLGKIDQAFGNITILLTLRDEKVYSLKLSATAYVDRLFNDAKGFEGLMRVISF